MNPNKKAQIIHAADDPDYQALVKYCRRDNWLSSLLAVMAAISVALTAALSHISFLPPLHIGELEISFLWLVLVPAGLWGLSELAGRLGEKILDFKDNQRAQREAKELISRCAQRK